jgi:L-ascorbate metabolism protein UlaG (beta-lactamase superfamily)
MKNTITTRFAEKQAQISLKRKETIDRYPALWANMISEWNTPGADDMVWMMYSANYLFRTGNVRWAIDPLSLDWRLPEAPIMNLCRELQDLSFVLLTHSHKDHLDFKLLSALRYLPIRWVVPEFLLSLIQKKVGLLEEQILIPHPFQPMEFEGFRITPYDGQHMVKYPDGMSTGVQEMAYLVECSGKRWLFPGDTRIYDAKRHPIFDPIDTLFAHVWLGRSAALMDPPQLLGDFCQFCADIQPGRVILTHIEELGRDADNYWDTSHVKRIISHFQLKFPDIPIVPACMGERVTL